MRLFQKRFLLFSFFCLLHSLLGAQPASSGNEEENPKKIRMPKDRIVLDVNYDAWTKAPGGVVQQFRSPGFNLYLIWDYPVGYGPFSLAIGGGLSTHTVQSNAAVMYNLDGSYTSLVPRTTHYTVNKLVLNYAEVPLEIRLRTKGAHSFKMAVGGKVGYAYSIHTKIDDDDGKRKIYRIKNVDPLRYGITARIGYNKFNVQGFYALSELFKKGKGEPGMVQYSIGLGILLY